MLLGEPPPTRLDIHFSIMGVPVRIHPLFFLGVLILGRANLDIPWLLIFGGAVFVSLLMHELGHVMAFLHYGIRARVVLMFLGGVAIPDTGGGRGVWSNFGSSLSPRALSGWPKVFISAAGPAAGLGLAAVVIIATFLAGGRVDFDFSRGIHFWRVTIDDPALMYLWLFIESMLFCNILWSLLNLLPIFPLDGGQIARELFMMADPWRGLVYSLWLSIATSGAMVLWAVSTGNLFMGMWFFFFALGAFQQLQGTGRRW